MELRTELWEDPRDRQLAADTVAAFGADALVLTDSLGNSIHLTDAACRLFGDRAEALVNRQAYSLLGFGEAARMPKALGEALLGGETWRGTAPVGGRRAAVEASAVRRDGRLLFGILRISELRSAS
jgi:hypothetical protein